MDLTTLWEGKWIDVVTPDEIYYETAHGPDLVGIVPVIFDEEKSDDVPQEVVIRKERRPNYAIKEGYPHYTIITGRIEEDLEDSQIPRKDINRELEEEAGIIPKKARLVSALKSNPVHTSKAHTERLHLYFYKIWDYKQVEITGDGSEIEEQAESVHINPVELEGILANNNCDLFLETAFLAMRERIWVV